MHGIDGLRVADASIMPEIVNAPTHAACVMIGEKCARDDVRDDHRRPRSLALCNGVNALALPSV